MLIYSSQTNSLLRTNPDNSFSLKKSNLLVVAMIIAILFSGSKGFYLSLIGLISIFLFMSIFYGITRLKLRYFFLIVLLGSVFLVFYFRFDRIQVLDNIISMEADDTHPRRVQARKLIEDFTILGKGLGASVPGYSRDELGYGFELSFHNIIHKFGIISIFIFISFLVPILYSLNKIIQETSNIHSYIPLVLMLYLLPAWGNPTIFAPVNVILIVWLSIL